MKAKIAIIFFSLLLLLSCAQKQQKIEKYIEDGVEVIFNHIEPYEIKGEPNTLHLEEEFRIDTERDEIAEIGLTNIGSIKVDSEEYIYITNFKNPEAMILKFDRSGSFIASFARRGIGPGELQIPLFSRITDQDEIVITDSLNRKLVFYSKDGKHLKEIPLEFGLGRVYPFENGNYLITKLEVDFLSIYEEQQNVCILCDSELKKIKELARRKFPSILKLKKMNPIFAVPTWVALDEKIYIGKRDERYEISIYDSEGNLLRKIVKEYKPVTITEEDKKKVLEEYEREEDRKKIHFPDHWLPFQSVIPSDDGKLFVKTYEKGKSPDEYIHDIFNADGMLIGRINLKGGLVIKNNRLYCNIEKKSGYRELVVYKMRWE